jgi:lysophospholipase L1-like esterase
MIKELSKDKKVEYMDVYKTLEQDNKLNEEYTDDGLHLNDEGKEKVWNLLKKVVDKNGNKTN